MTSRARGIYCNIVGDGLKAIRTITSKVHYKRTEQFIALADLWVLWDTT
jgi:hypothetical protein